MVRPTSCRFWILPPKENEPSAFPVRRICEGRDTSHYATAPREEVGGLGISSASVPRS